MVGSQLLDLIDDPCHYNPCRLQIGVGAVDPHVAQIEDSRDNVTIIAHPRSHVYVGSYDRHVIVIGSNPRICRVLIG